MSVGRRVLIAVALVAVALPVGPAGAAPTTPDVSASDGAPLWTVTYPAAPATNSRPVTGMAFDPSSDTVFVQAGTVLNDPPRQTYRVELMTVGADGSRPRVREQSIGRNPVPVALASDPNRRVVYSLAESSSTPGGVYLSAFGPTGQRRWTVQIVPDGAYPDLGTPHAVAADPVTGQVYVAVNSTFRVEGGGNFSRPVTIAFSSTGQKLWEIVHQNFNFYPDAIRVDPGRGAVYVVGSAPTDRLSPVSGLRVVAMRSDGSPLWTLRNRLSLGSIDDVALDPVTGSLVVTGATPKLHSNWVTVAVSADGRVLWSQILEGSEDGFSLPEAIAVEPVSGTVIVTGDYTESINSSGSSAQTAAYAIGDGAVRWIDRYDGELTAGYDSGEDVVIDSDRGRIYVTAESEVAGTGAGYNAEMVTLAYDLDGQRVRVDHFAAGTYTVPNLLEIDPLSGTLFIAANDGFSGDLLVVAYPPAD